MHTLLPFEQPIDTISRTLLSPVFQIISILKQYLIHDNATAQFSRHPLFTETGSPPSEQKLPRPVMLESFPMTCNPWKLCWDDHVTGTPASCDKRNYTFHNSTTLQARTNAAFLGITHVRIRTGGPSSVSEICGFGLSRFISYDVMREYIAAFYIIYILYRNSALV